jgi:hypothetical protein
MKHDPKNARERADAAWSKESPPEDAPTRRKKQPVSYDQFYSYRLKGGACIFVPTGELWPASSVDAHLPWREGPKGKKIRPSAWLAKHQFVLQMTWTPGEPQIINGRVIVEGGWKNHRGARVFNLYKPPTLKHGDPTKATLWCNLIRKLWPDEAEHLFDYFAHRVQRPHEKINHCLVLGGEPGIGKDTVLAAVCQAIGPWNMQSISPATFLGRFNGFARAVVLLISEARDSGGYDRFQFYEHMKIYAAAPPDVMRIDEKFRPEYYVPNVCAPMITTNHATGLYLPLDDRRTLVAWSIVKKESFPADHWREFYRWYDAGGFGHVAAFLAQRDLSAFDPKAPPKKTEAFWTIVNAARAPEEAELADALERLGNPTVTTLERVRLLADSEFVNFCNDRKNRRVIQHRFEECGYVPVRNRDAKDGLWKIGGKRQVIYGRSDLDYVDLVRAARTLAGSVG